MSNNRAHLGKSSVGRLVSSLLCVILPVSACSGDRGSTGGSQDPLAGILSIDTLANGALHVVSAPEGVWAQTGSEPWRLVEDLRIGVIEGDEKYIFGSLRNVFPAADGRIWAMDSQAPELRLYDQDGTFIRAVGRSGEGPGEFGFNPCAFPGPEGEIWVEAGRRWQWFDAQGELLGQQPVTRQLGCGIQRWVSDDRFVAVHAVMNPEIQEAESSFFIHEREPSGEVTVTDTTFPPVLSETPTVQWFDGEGRERRRDVMPLVHRPFYVLGPNGHFWITEGAGDYRIRRQTLFGDTLIILERPHDPITVPDSVREEAMPQRRLRSLTLDRDFDPDEVPRVFPPFDRFIVGTDGTLWVQRRLEGGLHGFDVFAPDGRFLGPVEVPPGFDRMNIQRITPDHMYGTVRDEMDVAYVLRLSIQKPEG